VGLNGVTIGHPKVLEAAVIGMAHAKWQERHWRAWPPGPGRLTKGESLET